MAKNGSELEKSDKKKDSAGDDSASAGSVGNSNPRRAVKPPEERQKRGRWVLPLFLAITFLISWWFWSRG